MSSILKIETPRIFLPLLEKARYKGAWGGRGSGKSHFFAEMMVETAIIQHTRAVCIREVQKSLKESVKLLIEDKINKLGVGKHFEVLEDKIRCPHGGQIIFEGMNNHTADSIKSLEGYKIAWWEEAHTASQRSLDLLTPTIRADDAELWFSWNPETPRDPVDEFFRGKNKRSNAICIEVNWRDNPWFPQSLRDDMENDKRFNYDKYLHVWEGNYRQVLEGAVFAPEIRQAIQEKRITKVPHIPGKPVQAIWDLGFADFTSIWFSQCIGGEFRLIDFYQNQFKKTAHYTNVMQQKEYQFDQIILPHDAAEERLNTDRTTEQQVYEAFPNAEVTVLPNLGAGYKAQRIEAARNIFPLCWFDEDRCAQGLQNLKEWRYERDEHSGAWSRQPLHDDNSHAADAFTYFAIAITEPKSYKPTKRRRTGLSWQSA